MKFERLVDESMDEVEPDSPVDQIATETETETKQANPELASREQVKELLAKRKLVG